MSSPRLLLATIVALLVAGGGCKPRKKITAETLELTQTYKVQTGLAVAHYPKQMLASQVNEYVASLRPVAFGPFDANDELYISTNKTTATNILDEYVRILHQPFETDMKGWTETSRRATSCLGVYPGIEITATFTGEDGKRRRYWSCTFLKAPHGYKVSYVVTEAAAKTDEAVLRKILDATEITPLSP